MHLVLLVRNLDPGFWIQARGSRLEILQIVQIVPDLALHKCLHRNFSNLGGKDGFWLDPCELRSAAALGRFGKEASEQTHGL